MDDFDDFDCDFLGSAISKTNIRLHKIQKPSEAVSEKPYITPDPSDRLRQDLSPKGNKSKSFDSQISETPVNDVEEVSPTPASKGGSRRGRSRYTRNSMGKRKISLSKDEQEEMNNAAKTSLALKQLESASLSVMANTLDSSNQSLNDSNVSTSNDSDIEVVGVIKTPNGLRLSSDFTKTIKVKWKYEIKRITIRSDDSLGRLFDKLSSDVGKESKDLSFWLNGKELKRFDTCESAGITLASFVEARMAVKHITPVDKGSESADPSVIELKLQTCGESVRKATHLMKMHLKTKFETLMKDFADQQGKDVSNFKFMFDGEPLNPYDNPEFLDLEGGEVIDVYETKKDIGPIVIPPPAPEVLPPARGRGRGRTGRRGRGASRGNRSRGRGRR